MIEDEKVRTGIVRLDLLSSLDISSGDSPLIHLSAAGHLVPTSRGPLLDAPHSRTAYAHVQSSTCVTFFFSGKMLPSSWERIFVSLLCNMLLRVVQRKHICCLQFQQQLQFLRDDAPAAALTLHFAAFFSLGSLAEALIFIPAGGRTPDSMAEKSRMIFGNVLRGKFGRDLVGEWRPPRGM